MRHTKEPWGVAEQIDDCLVDITCDGGGSEGVTVTGNDAKANAERIVSCVNNCEGINPEAVPEAIKMLRRLYEFIYAAYGDCATYREVGAVVSKVKATGKDSE